MDLQPRPLSQHLRGGNQRQGLAGCYQLFQVDDGETRVDPETAAAGPAQGRKVGTATELLTEIVGHEAALKPVKTIGEAVTQNHLFDSELERRFIEALRRKAADGSARIEVKEDLVRGKAGYFLKAGAHHWRVEPQVSLGPDRGVVIPSKPDFVLWPETDSGCLPIAVFLDGWQYHKDKIGDDIAMLAVCMMILQRFIVRRIVYFLRSQGYLLSPTIIIGANNEGRIIADQLKNWGTSGLQIIGFVDEELPGDSKVVDNFEILGPLQNLNEIVEANEIEEIIVAPTALSRDELLCIYREYSRLPNVNIRLSSGLFEILTTGLRIKEMLLEHEGIISLELFTDLKSLAQTRQV